MITLLAPMVGDAQSGPPSPVATPVAGPGDTDSLLYASVLPDQRDGVMADTAGRLSRYRVEATLTPVTGDQLARIDGTVDVLYVNDTGVEQPTLYFRLYPNATEYGDGGMILGDVTVGDQAVTPALSVEETLATITLPTPVAPDTAIELHLPFQTIIPTDPAASYGMFAYDQASGTYALAHWLPLLAGYDPDGSWFTGPISVNGDPVFNNFALYDVTFSAPSDLKLVTSGVEFGDAVEKGALTRRHFVSGPARGFDMAADANFESASETVNGTVVTSWYNPDSVDGGKQVLDQGARALEIYSKLFGPYLYKEMDLVQVDLGNGAGGVEFPQLMFIGGDYYHATPATATIPGFLEYIVVHEVAHQWWYALVGNNQYRHAFTDEALANDATVIYFQQRYGNAAYEQQVDINLKLPYFTVLFSRGDMVVDQPTDSFPGMTAYAAIVYGKGPLGFEAIRQQIGDDAFFAGLRDYAARYRFTIATPDDLLHSFERASGQDLGKLWHHWFEAAEGRQDFSRRDFADLLVKLGR
jgi:hypothetical protein